MKQPAPQQARRVETNSRRLAIQTLAACTAGISWPATMLAALPSMTAGPFYPSTRYRSRELDWDADLTRVRRTASGDAPRAAGEWLDLYGAVRDESGRNVDGVTVEIWQCDVHGSYRHPRGAGNQVDEAFQGFGSTVTDDEGRYRFRTIRPVPYPGRTPHIHVLLRHPAWGERVSQLFVAGLPANDGDFLYRSLSAADRQAANMRLQPAPPEAEVKWLVEHELTVANR